MGSVYITNTPTQTTQHNAMTDKHSNNFAQAVHYHGDWHDTRNFDMLQGEDLRQANAEMQAEMNEANEWSKANPSDLMRGIEAEQAMSRSEARSYRYEEQQSYRR